MPPQAIRELETNPLVSAVVLDHPVEAFVSASPGIDSMDAGSNLIAQIDGLDERVAVDVAALDTGLAAHPDLNVAGG